MRWPGCRDPARAGAVITVRWSGYSLAPSVAIHFWYDFLIEAYGFAMDPKHSPLALTWGMGF